MKHFVLLLLCGLALAMREQSIAVKGTLLCGSKPANNVRVKLWEEDNVELTPIDPVFKVYHDCDDGIKPGSRKVKFYLPKSYITEGKMPKKTFDIGVLNLETIFPGEEREMIVSRMRRDFFMDDNYDD
ncbi:unnamed protein product [Heligmosomoides polygyrus]|uniref:Transthyretin-like family protein n=1 Tax=Heligmosomoides polygyrus TaxID=6339 RepID=A0A183FFF5_HELPZ|nr:unnamed protein product [Heligmosomoides polygyrus]